MGLSEVKQELRKLDKERLVDLLSDLYKKNKSVKEYLDFYVNPNEKELFLKYKDKVYEAFYPKRGDRLKLSDGKKAISDFKKLEASKELLSDLMLFYAETGVEFTNEFGDIDEPFYNSIASVYSNALALMDKENILDKFAERAKKIVDDTSGIGWGFHDELGDIYSDYYN
ncbi:MAG: hypothetical protein A2X11_12950 [Bacteroidetes bacterium GWE2_42_24]|nr:MAG: hypothetical protein A2X11_12950 [Bacteroidetes bacterium GWE2_42_24]OFY32350.1 MAG: hypothetical protein A2X09_13660 [Bacteroidetes bacterium GWF2_43_11]HCT84192.1 hypothetical protein [Candidatus Margulisiibacteriota bacterium]